MADNIDQMFANLRRPVFVQDPNSVPQDLGPGSGNIAPSGWLEDNSVSADVLQANSVIAGKVAANTITANEIAANTITASQIAANTITSNEIAANTIQASNILANSITASEIAANAITASEIAADAVTTTKILAGNVTASRMVATISGKGFGANDGAGSAPGFFFDLEGNSGLWRASGGVVKLNTAGSTSMEWAVSNKSYGPFLPLLDNNYTLGDSTHRWSTVYAGTGTINTSDRSIKKDISDSPLGLDFIRKLKPRVFRYRKTQDTQALEAANAAFDANVLATDLAPHERRITSTRRKQQSGSLDDAKADAIVDEARQKIAEIQDRHYEPVREGHRKQRPGRRLHLGLIAQEVRAVLDAEGIDVGLWQESADGLQSLGYTELFAPVIKAIQEQAAQIDALTVEIAELKASR